MNGLESAYKDIIEQLKANKRPFFNPGSDLKHEILTTWSSSLQNQDEKKLLFKVMTILGHGRPLGPEVDALFIQTLNHIDDADTLVYTLGALHKQVLARCEAAGERLDYQLLMALKKPLNHANPEVIEWGLRTIEQAGPQGVLLKQEVLAISTRFKGLFNSHWRQVAKLIELLKMRWNVHGR